MVFVPSLSHTSWVEQKTQQQLNKQNKQTRACFLVLGRCLCVWDKAGLNSTVPSLCNWLRRLRSVTYSFIALSLFMSFVLVLWGTQALTTCCSSPSWRNTLKHISRTCPRSYVCLLIFPLPLHTFSLALTFSFHRDIRQSPAPYSRGQDLPS